MIIYDYGGHNDFDAFGIFAVIAIVGVIAVIGLIMEIFFLLTMQKALNRCSPENRAMQPGMVWLSLIPLFNLVWYFFVVLNTSESLGAELRHRNILGMESSPGRGVGLAFCILQTVAWIPYVNIITGPAYVICWIVYWVRVSQTIRVLDLSPANAGAA